MDRTFAMVKPDGVARGLVGEVVRRFERKGLKLVAAKLEKVPEKRVLEQYREHIGKPFFHCHYPQFLIEFRFHLLPGG